MKIYTQWTYPKSKSNPQAYVLEVVISSSCEKAMHCSKQNIQNWFSSLTLETLSQHWPLSRGSRLKTAFLFLGLDTVRLEYE